MSGPTFLIVYLVLLVGGIIFAARLRGQTLGPNELPRGLRLDPYETAYLAGGPRAAVNAAIASLLHAGHLTWDAGKTALVPGPAPAEAATPLERSLHLAVAGGAGGSPRELFGSCEPALLALRARLVGLGLLVENDVRARVRQQSWMVMGTVLAIGVVRLVYGLMAGHAVGFLVVLLVVGSIAMGALGKSGLRSAAGEALLTDLKRRHAALERTASTRPVGLAAGDVALVAGLFGLGVLAAGAVELAATGTFMRPAFAAGGPGADFSADLSGDLDGGGSWSSDSGGSDSGGSDSGGSSCGSSCGGGCGGGCGG